MWETGDGQTGVRKGYFVWGMIPVTGLHRALRLKERRRGGVLATDPNTLVLRLSRIFCRQNNHAAPWSSLMGAYLCQEKEVGDVLVGRPGQLGILLLGRKSELAMERSP